MIQLNLLPDVKLEYIKSNRVKRLVMLGSFGVISLCIGILVVLGLIVFLWQGVRLNSLDHSISTSAQKLKNTPDIDKVLTVQSQLQSIDQLHAAKPVVSRLFSYITAVTPSKVTLQVFSSSFSDSTITLTGQTQSLEEVNKFVDTLKFTDMVTGTGDKQQTSRAFSKVVLQGFGRDSQGASFNISLNFSPDIFDSSKTDIKLVVPKITTTRSETERPNDQLFKTNTTPLGGDQQQ